MQPCVVVKTCSTVGSSQVDSDGWRVSRHTSGRAPEAKPWTNERQGIFALASWARAAEPSVEAVRVLASRQLTAVWTWWDVRARPAQRNGDRARLRFRVFDQSLWNRAGRFLRASFVALIVLAAYEDLTDGGFFCVHVIQTRDRGVFMLHGCYQERKTAGKRRVLLFHAFCGRQFITAGHKAELPVGLWSIR